MIEVYGNLWDARTDAICITTNGYVTKAGDAAMGAGCALEARARFPGIAKELGGLLQSGGNHVYRLAIARHGYYDAGAGEEYGIEVFSFPVKHHYSEKATPRLIVQSAKELAWLTDNIWGFESVTLPRPGCGYGRLSWDKVKELIEPILDDRFKIITFLGDKP